LRITSKLRRASRALDVSDKVAKDAAASSSFKPDWRAVFESADKAPARVFASSNPLPKRKFRRENNSTLFFVPSPSDLFASAKSRVASVKEMPFVRANASASATSKTTVEVDENPSLSRIRAAADTSCSLTNCLFAKDRVFRSSVRTCRACPLVRVKFWIRALRTSTSSPVLMASVIDCLKTWMAA